MLSNYLVYLQYQILLVDIIKQGWHFGEFWPLKTKVSRSIKKDIIKDGGYGSEYWRTIRRVQKHHLSKIPKNIDVTFFEVNDKLVEELEPEIPHNKQIINDYDYCDYRFINCGIEHTRK